MSRGDQILIEVGRRTGWIFGSGRMVVPAIKTARCPRQWDEGRKAWMIPESYVSDVTAALEYQFGCDLEVRSVDR